MDVARGGLAVEALAVALAIFLLDPVDLAGIDAEEGERLAAHHHGRFEHFADGAFDVERGELHQVKAVEGPDEHRRLRESLEDRLQPPRGRASAVEAEEDGLGIAAAGEAKQVEAGAVAIIDFRAEIAADLDLAGLGIYEGD